MPLDPAANFIRTTTDSSIASTDTTISVADASIVPDPSSQGAYNLVCWDANTHPRPDQDSDVEIVRVTGRDTTTDDLTVARGQEGTSDVSHPSGAALQLSPTAKMFGDIESEFDAFWDSSASELTADVNNSVVRTEELNNIPALSAWADSGDGTWTNPYKGNWQAAIDESMGTIYVPPGRYEIDSTLEVTPPNHLIGAGTGGKDRADQPGAEFYATTGLTRMVHAKQSTNDDNKEIGIFGITFNGNDNTDTLLDLDSIRKVWVGRNWFLSALGDAVTIDSRIVNFYYNEIEACKNSARGTFDFSLSIDGSNNRTVNVMYNSITSNQGGVYIKPKEFDLNFIQNRVLRITKSEEFLRIDGGANIDKHPLRIIDNTFMRPTSDSPPKVIQTPGGGDLAGPVWIVNNAYFGSDTDGNIHQNVAVQFNDDVSSALYLRDNYARDFNFDPWGVDPVSNLVQSGNRGDGRLDNSGTASIADGGAIAHGLSSTPPIAKCRVETASSNRAYVTATDGSNLTTALEDPSGAAVTTAETVFWNAKV
jgi:hypothetical protein